MSYKLFSSKSKTLMDEIEKFLDCISNAVLVFQEGIKDYFHDKENSLNDRCRQISEFEREADNYLQSIRHNFYSFQLVPDSSADMLELFDDIDDLVDTSKETLVQLNIENPEILYHVEKDIRAMGDASVAAADELIKAVRIFFTDVRQVDSFIKNVYYYEKKVDSLENKIKKDIFSLEETGLARKIQGRNFVEKIAQLSDEAEEVAKNLLIYKIKRNI